MSTTTGPDATGSTAAAGSIVAEDTATASAGWYPDPFAPGDATRYRWWDGTAWGVSTVWDGTRWVQVPTPGVPPRRPRTARAVLVLIGVIVVVGGGFVALLGILGLAMDQSLTHDLIATDFATSPDPFEVGSGEEAGPYTFATEGGRYVITATADGSHSTVALGDFARLAYTVDLSTTVSGLADGSSASLSCSGADDPLNGYYLQVGPDGASLLRQEDGTAVTLAEAPDVVLDDGAHILELSCHQSFPNPSDQTLTASVDGKQVLSAQENDPVVDGYAYAGLGFWSEANGQRAAFGDVVATVPE